MIVKIIRMSLVVQQQRLVRIAWVVNINAEVVNVFQSRSNVTHMLIVW